jgi:hypothetical protein
VSISRKTGDTEGVARASWLLAMVVMAQGGPGTGTCPPLEESRPGE